MVSSKTVDGDSDVNYNDDSEGGCCGGVGRGVAGPEEAVVCLQDQ